MENVYLAIPLAPLFGAIIAGLFGRQIGRAGAHWVTILGVGASFLLSLVVLKDIVIDGAVPFNGSVYTWMVSDGMRFEIGFLIDKLTALMMTVVTFVSLMVHIYTIGYMHEDPGYQRFFSYIALFTFAMLMLVMSNNFLQLFFGWEAVGLVSYLLIGFWYTRPSAIYANLKAFLVNRVGDFGFLLGIAAIYMAFNSMDYATVFDAAPAMKDASFEIIAGTEWQLMSVICIFLFIGAMGKSAQVPLHVWLPDSMEGPTPISALIHAATMVTAGIFMVARMSPLFELSETALVFVMIIGAITALFMGFLGIVQNDIKRVVAYSTLSQLGYMTVALGVSAYAAGIFHLMTHAFFKALLFLGAGSVIIAMHHDQDIRNMGGLRKYMPVTWITSLIGSLALIGTPFFSGFYSKDTIIEAVHHSQLPGSGLVYIAVLLGVFITALYSFRMYFLVFHGEPRMDAHTREHLHETPWVITVPLILLAIPSVISGYLIDPVVFGEYFKGIIHVDPVHDVLTGIGEHYHGPVAFVLHAFKGPAIYLAIAGVATAWYIYMKNPGIADAVKQRFRHLYRLLVNKYYADKFNDVVFAGGARGFGHMLWKVGDTLLIDGLIVNGSARMVGWVASVVRHVQSGYLYHYAFSMIIGLLLLLFWFVFIAPGMGRMTDFPLLSVLIWLPVLGGVLLLAMDALGTSDIRPAALVVSILTFLVSTLLYTGFDTMTPAMQFGELVPWIDAISANYHLGVDGISMPLIILTTFTTVLVVLAGWQVIQEKTAQYMASFLIMEGLMNGVFAALDAVLFYVFWEAMLVPMFLIIGIWGGPRRVYATIKFFLFTFFGSVFMLVALIYMYLESGSFGILDFHRLPLDMTEQILIFIAFLLAFAVKVPMWPVHTWLPDAHVEAPTGGSVILAAIMLKIGGYGFLRFSLPITPDASHALDWLIIFMSLVGVVYIGFVALVQEDMKKLIAYSSIAHMGFVTLGFFLVFTLLDNNGSTQGAALGMEGGMVQMISHGFISGALFLCVGVLYDRLHSRKISDYGGVVNTMPVFAAFMVLFAMANSGLPGTSGFVGEFMVILASFKANFWFALLAATTLILGAAYSLWLVKRVIFGDIANDGVRGLEDINSREFIILASLAAVVLLFGVWPAPLVEVMHASVDHLVAQVTMSKLPHETGLVLLESVP